MSTANPPASTPRAITANSPHLNPSNSIGLENRQTPAAQLPWFHLLTGKVATLAARMDARAAYGKQILVTVSQELRAEFGDGFTLRSLYSSIQFFELFPDEAIVSTLSAQLRWSHFMELLPLKDALARDFYGEISRIKMGAVWK
jgi:hypothetical protein